MCQIPDVETSAKDVAVEVASPHEKERGRRRLLGRLKDGFGVLVVAKGGCATGFEVYRGAELIYAKEHGRGGPSRVLRELRRVLDLLQKLDVGSREPSAEPLAADVRELAERHGEKFAELAGRAYGAWEESMRQLYGEAFEELGGEERRRLFAALSTYMAWVKALGAALLEMALGRGKAKVAVELCMYGGEAAAYLSALWRLSAPHLDGDEYDWAFSPDAALALDAFFRDLGAGLARYDWAKAPGADLLGRVYQRILPEELRRQLGEYYTPSWIVKLMLWRALHLLVRGKTPNELLPAGDADREIVELLDEYYKKRGAIPRFVDPTCGSFAFGVQYIDALIKWYGERRPGLKPAEFVEEILSNVVGIDVSPTAVATAKTNYMLQICRFLVASGVHLPRPPILPIIRLDLLALHQPRGLFSEESPETGDWAALNRRLALHVARGGFDLVLGNLPWVGVSKRLEDYRRLVKHVAQSLGVQPPGPAAKKMDMSIPLFAVALRHLTNSRSVVALMVPASIFRGVHGARWRELLAKHKLAEVWVLGDVKPFVGAQSQPGIVFVAV